MTAPSTQTGMSAPLRCHLLIGPPASGKSTLAHALRPWRLAITKRLALPAPVEWIGWRLTTPLLTCIEWNQRRQRQVSRAVIERFAAALAHPFPPDCSEGFAMLVGIDPSTPEPLGEQVQRQLHGQAACPPAMTPSCSTESQLLLHLEAVARPRHLHWNRLGLLAVRSYLQDWLSALGPVEEHGFDEGQGEGINLILRLAGQQPDLPPLLVGAHYDGPFESIGADDNASGIAALLLLAGRWAEEPPRRPVWIVAFDQEEWGMLGSTALARELRRSRQRLQLMVSLEMLAYTGAKQNYPIDAMRHLYGDRGDFIAVVGNIGAGRFLPGLARRMGVHVSTKVLPVHDKGRSLPDVRLSDHSPFWDAGYDAVMVTDTSFLRNPHYHRMSDTIDTLDLPFLAAVTEGLDAALRRV